MWSFGCHVGPGSVSTARLREISERAAERQQRADAAGSVDFPRVEAFEARAVAALGDGAKAERAAASVDDAAHPDARQLRICQEVRHQFGERGATANFAAGRDDATIRAKAGLNHRRANGRVALAPRSDVRIDRKLDRARHASSYRKRSWRVTTRATSGKRNAPPKAATERARSVTINPISCGRDSTGFAPFVGLEDHCTRKVLFQQCYALSV